MRRIVYVNRLNISIIKRSTSVQHKDSILYVNPQQIPNEYNILNTQFEMYLILYNTTKHLSLIVDIFCFHNYT